MIDTTRCANPECRRETGPHNPLDVGALGPENEPVRICRDCSDEMSEGLAVDPLPYVLGRGHGRRAGLLRVRFRSWRAAQHVLRRVESRFAAGGRAVTLLPADADKQVANARSVRRQLAAERCWCGAKCGVLTCNCCGRFQPRCELVDELLPIERRGVCVGGCER